MKFQRDFENFKTACIPWEMKIKEIESKYLQKLIVSSIIFLMHAKMMIHFSIPEKYVSVFNM